MSSSRHATRRLSFAFMRENSWLVFFRTWSVFEALAGPWADTGPTWCMSSIWRSETLKILFWFLTPFETPCTYRLCNFSSVYLASMVLEDNLPGEVGSTAVWPTEILLFIDWFRPPVGKPFTILSGERWFMALLTCYFLPLESLS